MGRESESPIAPSPRASLSLDLESSLDPRVPSPLPQGGSPNESTPGPPPPPRSRTAVPLSVPLEGDQRRPPHPHATPTPTPPYFSFFLEFLPKFMQNFLFFDDTGISLLSLSGKSTWMW
jgi:hypothetical protein